VKEILLIDADHMGVDTAKNDYPNLALIKLSAWHKQQGDNVTLSTGHTNVATPDKVYIGVVFTWNAHKALQIYQMYKARNIPVRLGGYPVAPTTNLPQHIEHIMPDYNLYPTPYSLGFTSRGCIRKCSFCIVPLKEGHIHHVASIHEFLHPQHTELRILDNNLLASPKAHETLEEIAQAPVTVDYNQGLDIRLVTPQNAKLLHATTPTTYYRFSYDTPNITKQVEKGIQTLIQAGIRPRQLSFYMLIGKDTTFEQDMYRFKILKKHRVNAYPMIYKPIGNMEPPITNYPTANMETFKKCVSQTPLSSIFKLARWYNIYEERRKTPTKTPLTTTLTAFK